jgi:purine-binding chemotaxis protein CheW
MRQRHDPLKNLVGFVVGDVEYAAPIARVKEIANPLPVVALPHAPNGVAGVADYRGEVVPVIELRARFGLPDVSQTRRTKWLVLDVGGRYVALVVDAVTEVFGTGGADLLPAPGLGGGDDVRGIAGVTKRARLATPGASASYLVFVLDVGKFGELTEPLARAFVLGGGPGAPPLPKAGPP